MLSVILPSCLLIGECCLRTSNCSGGRMWFWWIKEFSLWATPLSRKLLKIVKRLMGLWEPEWNSGYLDFGMGIPLAHFQGWEISKHQSMVKKLREVVDSLRERFRSMVPDMPSILRADFFLRDWIRRRSSQGLWAEPHWGEAGEGGRKNFWQYDMPCVLDWLYRRLS